MIYFTDENISEYFARMLDIFDQVNEVRAHIDYFEKGTPDVEWIKQLTTWGKETVIICGDSRILSNKAEKAVLKECNLMFVLLASGWTKMPYNDLAWKIVKVWPDITKKVSQANYPMIFDVSLNLKIRSRGRVSSL